MAVYYDIDRLPEFKNAVITIGTFDGVHLGHKAILNEVVKHARNIGGESILLTFEPHPRKLLYPDQPLKLLTPLSEKIELITAEGIQNIVVVPFTKEFSNLTAAEYIEQFLVEKFHPKDIVIGYDHRFGHDRTGNIDLLRSYAVKHNFEVFEISAQLIDEAAVSSTKIRQALIDGYVADAHHMLGRSYFLSGTVVAGAKLGRTINFPTANIHPQDKEQLIPANGVYAITAAIDDATYKGMLNIGHRPTVSNDIALHIEAHLFDFNEDIYGRDITIAFIERLRDEVKFNSLDELKAQLAKDKENSIKVLG